MSGFHLGVLFAFLGVCLGNVVSQHVCFTGTAYGKDGKSFRWFLPYEDPCVCTAIRLGGHLPYKPATGRYLEGLFLSEDSNEIRKFFDCQELASGSSVECTPSPLGVEKGDPLPIQDGDFTASSVDAKSTPASAKLNFRATSTAYVSGWKPMSSSGDEWIQVDLGKDVYVYGIITQGRYSSTEQHWVTRYTVQYTTLEDANLVEVKSRNRQIQTFNGNTDGDTQVTNSFDVPVIASTIRIVPVSWNIKIALRFELLGCIPMSVRQPAQ